MTFDPATRSQRSGAPPRATLSDAGFTPIVSEDKVGSRREAGTVARTEPSGGSRFSKGGAVTIYVSGGE